MQAIRTRCLAVVRKPHGAKGAAAQLLAQLQVLEVDCQKKGSEKEIEVSITTLQKTNVNCWLSSRSLKVHCTI